MTHNIELFLGFPCFLGCLFLHIIIYVYLGPVAFGLWMTAIIIGFVFMVIKLIKEHHKQTTAYQAKMRATPLGSTPSRN